MFSWSPDSYQNHQRKSSTVRSLAHQGPHKTYVFRMSLITFDYIVCKGTTRLKKILSFLNIFFSFLFNYLFIFIIYLFILIMYLFVYLFIYLFFFGGGGDRRGWKERKKNKYDSTTKLVTCPRHSKHNHAHASSA